MKRVIIAVMALQLTSWAEATVVREGGPLPGGKGHAPLELKSGDLKSLVEQKHLRVKASRLELQAAEERKGAFARSFFPSLKATVAQESFQVGRQERLNQPLSSLEAEVNLFNGGQDRLRGDLQDLTAKRKTVELQLTTAQELDRLRLLYWRALALREKLKAIDEALKINTQNRQAAERRIRNGVSPETDRIEFEMAEADLKIQKDEWQVQQKQIHREMLILLDEDLQRPLALMEAFDHDHDLSPLLKHSHQDHEFLYRGEQIKAEESRLEALSQGRKIWPRVDLVGGVYQHNQREKNSVDAADRRENFVALRATLSLAALAEDKREASRRELEAEAAELRAKAIQQEAEVHFANEREELELLHREVHEAEENIKRSDLYDRLTRAEYARGVKNSPDVLGAAEKRFSAQLKRIEMVHRFQIAKAHLLSKTGR